MGDVIRFLGIVSIGSSMVYNFYLVWDYLGFGWLFFSMVVTPVGVGFPLWHAIAWGEWWPLAGIAAGMALFALSYQVDGG